MGGVGSGRRPGGGGSNKSPRISAANRAYDHYLKNISRGMSYDEAARKASKSSGFHKFIKGK